MMVEIEPKKVKRKNPHRRRMLSPPELPPRWGEGVAPPPTPQFTPHVSPEASSESTAYQRAASAVGNSRPIRRPKRPFQRPILGAENPYPYPNEHIVYEYRFNENQIERWPLNDQPRYPNSAESSSPPPWESAGSSPEYLNQVAEHQVPRGLMEPGSIRRRYHHPTSPVSVISYEHQHPSAVNQLMHQQPQPRLVRRSALRQEGQRPSSRRSGKSVHWVSDFKKKAQDISSDRKIVKVQVQINILPFTF